MTKENTHQEIKNRVQNSKDPYKEYIKYLGEYYSNKEIPNTVKAALEAGEKPAFFTYKTVKAWFGVKLLEVLDDLKEHLGKDVDKPNTKRLKHDMVKECEELGLELIKEYREQGVTKLSFTCNNCNEQYEHIRSTVQRWYSRGYKYCMSCRNTNARIMTTEEHINRLRKDIPTVYTKYIDIIDFKSSVDTGTKHTECLVKFLELGKEKWYTTTTLRQLLKKGKALAPQNHNSGAISMIEIWSKDIITDKFPNVEYQVPYRMLAPCISNWVSDFYLKDINTVIEVTTKEMAEQNKYQAKKDWCALHGINLIVSTSLVELEDIVRTLGKPKE